MHRGHEHLDPQRRETEEEEHRHGTDGKYWHATFYHFPLIFDERTFCINIVPPDCCIFMHENYISSQDMDIDSETEDVSMAPPLPPHKEPSHLSHRPPLPSATEIPDEFSPLFEYLADFISKQHHPETGRLIASKTHHKFYYFMSLYR